MIHKVDIDDIPVDGRTGTTKAEIEQFLKTGWVACKVDYDSPRTPDNVAYCYRAAAIRMNAPCRVIKRGNDVFLVRTDT